MEKSQLHILNEMPFLFWAKDEEGRYLWGNRAVCELTSKIHVRTICHAADVDESSSISLGIRSCALIV